MFFEKFYGEVESVIPLLIGAYFAGLVCSNDIPRFTDKVDRNRFYQDLTAYREARNISEKDLISKSNVLKQVFSNIRNMKKNNYLPSKATVIALCLALELNLDESQKLLSLVGYCLSNNFVEDRIIAWCMENGYHNINEIDQAIREQTGKYFLSHA